MAPILKNISHYIYSFLNINRNCRLSFAASMLNGISQGIFLVVFNLYILEMGINPGTLGGILSAGPLAQALGSIPIGFLAEKVGFRKVFFMIYGISGLAKLVQVASGNVSLISIAAFISGLALAGDFVVRISFLAENTLPEQRTRIYSLNSMMTGLSMSLGALVAGHLPNLFTSFHLDLITAYRYTLYLAGALTLLAVLPNLKIEEAVKVVKRKISLMPYLWGIDRLTTQQAVVSLFIGLSIGMLSPFMNVFFVYHLGTTREFFSSVSALNTLFTISGAAVAPLIAGALGAVAAVTYLRLATMLPVLFFALTGNPFLGAGLYWSINSLFQMAQPLSFAFAMRAATAKAKAAVSAWLNVTFWIGQALAAPLVGAFIDHSNYQAPMYISAICIVLAAGLTYLFFIKIEHNLDHMEEITHASEVQPS